MASEAAITGPVAPPAAYWQGVGRRLLGDPVAVACLLLLGLIVVSAALAPWISPADPNVGDVTLRLKPVGTPGHLLGTDELGRDMLTRLLYGGRTSLVLGILPVLLAVLIGGGLGIMAGFVGGWVNSLIMRAADVVFAFPSILLAVAIAGALGAGLVNSLAALTIVLIPPVVRVAESATTQVRALDFVEAGIASGAGTFRVVRVHVLANVLSPVLVYASSLLSVSIILGAGLSFIGLGVSPPTAEWGLMLNTLRTSIYSHPLLAALPGVLIFATSLSFNLLSDGLRSAMDIK